MKIRFQADQDLNQDLVKGVQRRDLTLDFRTAVDAKLRGLADADVLQIAAKDNRILVSHDFKTMPAAFARFVERNPSPGVLIVPQAMPIGTAVEILFMIWAASDAGDWSNRICRLPL